MSDNKRIGRQSITQQAGSPHCRLGAAPVNPLASLAEEDDNKMCLPAKRQPISTLGISTVNAPFSTLQEKARRHLPPNASLRQAKLGVFARESAE